MGTQTRRLAALTVALSGMWGCQIIAGYEPFEVGPSGAGGAPSGGGAMGSQAGGMSSSSGGMGSPAGGSVQGGGTAQAGGSTGAEQACTESAQCGGLVCLFGYCRPACTADTGCAKTSVCLGTAQASGCRLAGDVETKCTGKCESPELTCAIDGTCRTPCNDNKTCPFNGQVCIQGACVSQIESSWATTWGVCAKATGELTCGADGKTLTSCNITKPGPVNLGACGTAELCQAAAAAGQMSCNDSGCTEGDLRCVGAELQRCNAGKTGYEKAEECASEPLCLRSKDENTGKCLAPVCGDGTTLPKGKCEGGDVMACDPTQQTYEKTDCSDVQQCNPETRTCVSFTIDETEVTRAQYAGFKGKTPDKGKALGICQWNDSYQPGTSCTGPATPCSDVAGSGGAPGASCDDHPQTCVDFCDAYDYCLSVGKRLCGRLGKPGEMVDAASLANAGQSEWYNACSAGGEHEWVVGNTFDAVPCNDENNASGPTATLLAVKSEATCVSKVKAYAGKFDLSGNAAEWEFACKADPVAQDLDGSSQCHARGGSFDSSDKGVTCKTAEALPVKTQRTDVGFRCCSD